MSGGVAPAVTVVALNPELRDAWQQLASEYKAFYATPTLQAEYDKAWQRLIANDGVHGLAALVDDRLVGLAHYLFHTSTWTPTVCYLQDLYTAPASRGRGVARTLIEAVAERARQAGAQRYYWLTRENNATARVLYERVAKFNGFIRYDFAMDPATTTAR